MQAIRRSTELGELVRKVRKDAALRQADAAALCGVGIRFLSDLENGKETAHLGKTLQVLNRLGIRLHAGNVNDRQVDSQDTRYGSPRTPSLGVSEQSSLATHKQDLWLHKHRGGEGIDSLVQNAREMASLAKHPGLAGINTVTAESRRMQQVLRRGAEKLAGAGVLNEACKIAMAQEKQIKTLADIVSNTAGIDGQQFAEPIRKIADTTNQLADLLKLKASSSIDSVDESD